MQVHSLCRCLYSKLDSFTEKYTNTTSYFTTYTSYVFHYSILYSTTLERANLAVQLL